MTSGLLQNLAQASRTIANHPDPAARFGMAVGFICDIALQNDLDGLWIAIERGVEDYIHLDDETEMARGMGVRRIRDRAGKVIDLQLQGTDWVGHEYVELAREIALLKDREARIIALEAAAIRLIQDGQDLLQDHLATVARVRSENFSVVELGIPLCGQARSQMTSEAIAEPQGVVT